MKQEFWKLIIVALALSVTAASYGQKYKVESMTMDQLDLTARTNKRVDLNGRPCAVLKIMVPDKIVDVEGNKVGEIDSKGLQKIVYVSHDTKQINLLFENHYPLRIVFDDYNIPSVTERVVYNITLVEDPQSAMQVAPVQQSTVPLQEVTHSTPTQTESEEEILKQAILVYGDGDYDRAIHLFKSIPENTEALTFIGNMYRRGEGVAQSYTEAVYWYSKAAEKGDKYAQYNLGVSYEYGYGITKSYPDAVYWYRKAAEEGMATAQDKLGVCYYNGNGVNQSSSDAVYWFRKAAEHGYANAQHHLAICYENGEGVPQSYTDAVYWSQKAAKQGNANAQYNLSVYYERGRGVAQSFADAAFWAKKAAEQGNAEAQNNLGVYYYKGQGVSQSFSDAVYWTRKAAEQGAASAQRNLGIFYKAGHGVAQSEADAVYWFKKAAEQGDTNAINELKERGLW